MTSGNRNKYHTITDSQIQNSDEHAMLQKWQRLAGPVGRRLAGGDQGSLAVGHPYIVASGLAGLADPLRSGPQQAAGFRADDVADVDIERDTDRAVGLGRGLERFIDQGIDRSTVSAAEEVVHHVRPAEHFNDRQALLQLDQLYAKGHSQRLMLCSLHDGRPDFFVHSFSVKPVAQGTVVAD